MSTYNFSPATPDDPIVHGACRPAHPVHTPPNDTVADWLEYMDRQGIERVCCLLDDHHLTEYDDLLQTYREHFGPTNVCHAPIPDFTVVESTTLHETILPFLETSVEQSEPVVVHCSAGSGRTGHVLALWLVHGRGYDLDDAIQAVTQSGRNPLEAASRDDLEDR